MNDFVFHNPVKVIFGRGSIPKIGSEAALLGDSILLVYGQESILKNGIYDLVIESLTSQGLTIVEHPGVSSNPLLSHVNEGIAKAKSSSCNAVIGVGGGSVMDTAKAIASGVSVEHDIWKFFTGKKSIRNVLPIMTIPTVAGSGSEVNSGMVLTHDEKKIKLGFAHRRLHPQVCLADPEATFTVPLTQSAYGAVDTVTHCLEAYFTASYPHPPFQSRLLENICKTVIESITDIITTPDSYDARSNLLWCASMALCGLGVAGIGRIAFPLHLIEHGISARHDIAHGAGLAAILPGWLSYHQSHLAHQLSDFGRHVFAIKRTSEPSIQKATISSFVDFFQSINVPTSLSDIGIYESDYEQIIDHCLVQAKIWRFKDFDRKTLFAILDYCQKPL